MSTKGSIGIAGLKTSGNELQFQPGSLTQADNCMLPTKGVIQPRRGQKSPGIFIDNDAGDSGKNRAREMYQWGNHVFVNMRSSNSGVYSLGLFESFIGGGVTYHALGTQTPPDPTVMRMKFAALAKSAYWTTALGLYGIDSPANAARAAGVKAPLEFYQDPTASGLTGLTGNPNAIGSWMAANTAVAGRMVVGYKDANSVVHPSKPNGRTVIINPADVLAATGNIVILSNVVTATVLAHNFKVGDILNLSATDGGVFTQTNNVVTAITSTTIVWAQAHANHTSGVDITLTSGAKSLQWICYLPAGLTTSNFVQLNRTSESISAATDPGDECFVAYERFLTATDIANGYVTISDTCPSSQLGAPLATNANTGDGVARGSNERPPLCRDVCVWDGKLWGAHTTDSHRLSMRLLGTGAPGGLQVNDVVCINAVGFTFASVFTQFLPSTNVLAEILTLALSYAIATGRTGTFLRNKMTGLDDGTFGQMTLEEDGVGGAPLYAATSRASAFADRLATVVNVTEASSTRTGGNLVTITAPSHGFSSGDSVMLAAGYLAGDVNFPAGVKGPITVTNTNVFTYAETGSNATMGGTYFVYALTFKSDNNVQALRYSKPGQPEAWPLPFFPGGLPDGADPLRIRSSPDGYSLLVMLVNGDTYAISGQYPYSTRRVDGTASLVGADSLVEHGGSLYGLTTQGAATISAIGVGVVGRDVEEDTRALSTLLQAYPTSAAYIWAMPYESDRQYQLWLPLVAGDASAKSALVYGSMDAGWTKMSGARTCGFVAKGYDWAIFGDGATNQFIFEQKTFGASFYTSFYDGLSAVFTVNGSYTTIGSTVHVYEVSAAGVTAGDIIIIGGTYYRVTAVGGFSNADNSYITIDGSVSVNDLDAMTAYLHYVSTVTFAMEAAGIPGVEKAFREVQLHFGERLFPAIVVNFTNEKDQTAAPVTVVDSTWTYGVPKTGPTTVRVDVPEMMQQSAMLKVSLTLPVVFSYFKLLGYSATSQAGSEKTGR